MTLAPIALFVYNRPSHTRRTVEALLKNYLAAESDLIVFSDAPKNDEALETVHKVREYIRTITGFRSINIIERDKNRGLANSIIDGVTTIVKERGRVIVLEDDLVTAPYFLSFMNSALDAYQDDGRVMHISGYMFPIDTAGLKETFFLRITSCWGWATWDRAWERFEKDTKKLLKEYTEQRIKSFNMDGAFNIWAQVEQNDIGLINTWAVYWYASAFEAGGLCLYPAISMVNNIGFDNSGEHCDCSVEYETTLASNPISYFEKNILLSELAYARTRKFFMPAKANFLKRILRNLSRLKKTQSAIFKKSKIENDI